MHRIDSMVRVRASSVDPVQFRELREKLVLKGQDEGQVLEMYRYDEARDELVLPRSMKHLFPGLEDATTEGHEMDAKAGAFEPRDGQDEAVTDTLRYLATHGGGQLLAACGSGKTVMGAEIALRIGRSTCVLVHKEFLAQQWREAFEMLSPGIKIGLLQRDSCDFGPPFDVTIAIVQSVTNPKRTYPKEFYESFGLLICDEVHRYGADVWQDSITQFPARYRLGLTATFRRWDGMLPVIENHIGPVAFELEKEGLKPRVHFVRMSTTLERKQYVNRWNGETNRGKLVSLLAANESRTEAIVRQMLRALEAGRKVLVLSERLAQISWMSGRCKAHGISEDDIGHYVGGRAQADLDIAATKKLIFGTYQMAQEGLDIPDLDTLFLATPRVDVEQSVGRILREQSGKKEPVVVDFVDMGVGPCVGFSKARQRLYESLGYKMAG